MRPHDRVRAHCIVLCARQVHGAALARQDPVLAPEQLGHHRRHGCASNESVSVAPGGAERVVVVPHRLGESGGHRLLPQRQVARPLDEVLQKQVVGALFEVPDLADLAIHVEARRLVELCLGGPDRRSAHPSSPSSPSETSMPSGFSSWSEAIAWCSRSFAKSTSTLPLPIIDWTISRTSAATGMGTSSSRAAARPRSKSFRNSNGVNVGVKSRFTNAGVLYFVKVDPITLLLRKSRNALRRTPPFSASTVISAIDCVTTPSIRLWQILTRRAASPSPT